MIVIFKFKKSKFKKFFSFQFITIYIMKPIFENIHI